GAEMIIAARHRSVGRKSWVLSAAAMLLAVTAWPATPATVRMAVEKKRSVAGNPPVLLFSSITSPALAASGFTLLADYATRTVYDGPAAAADSLRSALLQAGYRSSIASDLNQVVFHEVSVDPATAAISPPPAGSYTPT